VGNHWVKDTDGIWKPVLPWAKPGSGWTRVKIAYRKTSSTVWSVFQTVDLTPPLVPRIESVVVEGKLLHITVTAPTSSDVSSIRVKVAKNKATANSDTTADYVGLADPPDDTWSDWHVTPGQTRDKYYPPADLGDLTSGATYYVTAWARDTGRNFSSPVTQSQKFTTSTGALPSARSVYVTTTDSGTFNRTTDAWAAAADKGVRTGDVMERVGMFFYGSKLQTTLAKSIELSQLTLQIQRLNHVDYRGASQFKLLAHNLATKTSADIDHDKGLSHIVATDSTWHTLAQGATGNFVIPGAWYDKIRNGTIKGFGIYSQASSGNDTTDFFSGSYYGFGTNSGRLFAEWTQ
jgi:hypothetical protein